MASIPKDRARALVESAPHFSVDDAVRIARELYGLSATAGPLPSERDQNFLLRTADGQRCVLKIANSTETEPLLDFQNRALAHVAARAADALQVSTVIPTRDGQPMATAAGADGATHFVRLVNYLPGECFGTVKPHSAELLASLGAAVARVDAALADFTHAAMHREFHWDLKLTSRMREHLPLITDATKHTLAESVLQRFEQDVQQRLNSLPAQVIHNDANDYNVLVAVRACAENKIKKDAEAQSTQRTAEKSELRVTGLLDFGDMVHAPRICGLAVACTYALLAKPDPIAAAAQVVRGYHSVAPLEERELELLFDLIHARLAISVSLSAMQHSRKPDNEYLRLSESQAWSALEQLARIPRARALYAFCHACGMPPCPHSARVVEWLQANQESFAPVVKPAPRTARLHVFDLSAGSLELPAGLDPTEGAKFSGWVFDAMRAAGAEIGIGRYAEPRICYRGSQFARKGNDGPVWRTVHLGIDLFMPAGTPVYAPLDGTVHSFADNVLAFDYGPTIILQHDAGGTTFYTLYGHLSRESLAGLREGVAVKRGQQIGTMGDIAINGGWPPHVHFQIICDMLEKRGDFFGVGAAGEREIWLSISPDPNLILQIPANKFPAPRPQREDILQSRRAHTGASVSVSYKKPLHIVHGFMQHLYDADGRAYLDAVNNVPHVGHSHPRVVRALAQQAAVLNTNTRYLYGQMTEYIERLTATLPEPLRVVFLVSSGSEANELALRLARAHTRRRDVMVIDRAYHGNTAALIEISPYKFNGPGGTGKAEHVHVIPCPDRRGGPLWPPAGRHGGLPLQLAAFISEPMMSGAGQIIFPDGFLRDAYERARAAGAVCICDEVQVGFGRTGTHFWGFETQGVVPDIVTMGKPIGNGHPLGAVVTTREIADSFANGMEWFATFGGNPVSCAVGLAVLDVLRDEKLQQNALDVGTRLMDGLRGLQQRHAIIGEVRGTGFFIGVELVTNGRAEAPPLQPATAQAAYIVERMRDRGVLLGVEGPHHNVLKIRPPMCFSAADAGQFVTTLGAILDEDLAKPARAG